MTPEILKEFSPMERFILQNADIKLPPELSFEDTIEYYKLQIKLYKENL